MTAFGHTKSGRRIFAVWRLLALALPACLPALHGHDAFAGDANLTFTGTIQQPSCDVGTSSANQTVNLGSVPVMNFAAVGSAANPTAFSVNLVNCTAAVNVTMTVAGTMDTVPSVLQNTGTARQVGVQILQASRVGGTTGTPVTLNSAVSLGSVDGSGAMTIPFVAQFYRIGTLVAGSVLATATINFTYN
jgi:major type 1 subunit fimbrin (pilin)